MAREIKFRFWNHKSKSFCDRLIDSDGDIFKRSLAFDDYYWELEECDEVTAQQFTGLTDKNSKEIYEGDIVRFTFIDDEIYNYISEVKPKGIVDTPKYHENDMTLLEWLDGYDEVEVIGNIYENPELLESK